MFRRRISPVGHVSSHVLHAPRLISLAAAGIVFALLGCDATSAHPSGAAEAAEQPSTPSAAPAEALMSELQAPAGEPQNAQQPKTEHPFPNARPAPSLDGGVDWLNTAGPLDLRMLRGKFVVLDFWTYCCINCIHELPQLKKLEAAYPNEVVVIGVHSAKFETEENTDNIKEAILRYEISHPVVNDARHKIWENYGISSWPSLRIIDPEGKLVAGDSGEIPFEVLDEFLKKSLPYYEERGLVDKTPLRFELEAFKAAATPLRFPGKVLADEATGRLFIADSNHNRIVVSSLGGELQATIGSGEIGAADGDYATASFDHPQGMALRGETLYVADTENHTIRAVDLNARQVTTIAGTGKQAGSPWPGYVPGGLPPERFVGPPRTTPLSSPWDLTIVGDALYIAMAGPHQIWRMTLDGKEIGPFAGNGREDIVDGHLLPRQPYAKSGEDNGENSSFAQPSGLTTDGKWIYVADSEGSSVRAVPLDPQALVRTVVGTSQLPFGRLFEFGDVDGPAAQVRLQHCLGVAFADGKIYVADTYNNKVKVFDMVAGVMKTLAGDGTPGTQDSPAKFDEPAGISFAGGKLYVADTNNHLIRVVDTVTGDVSTLQIAGLAPPVLKRKTPNLFAGAEELSVAEARVKPVEGKLRLRVRINLPTGWKINTLAPMAWQVSAEGTTGAVSRDLVSDAGRSAVTTVAEPRQEIEISLPLTDTANKDGATPDTIRLAVAYYYCQEGNEGLCKAATAAWTIPLVIADDAENAAVQLQVDVKE